MNTNITNGILKVKLLGDILDKTSITSTNGFYNSADNTIFGIKEIIMNLVLLNPEVAEQQVLVLNLSVQ